MAFFSFFNPIWRQADSPFFFAAAFIGSHVQNNNSLKHFRNRFGREKSDRKTFFMKKIFFLLSHLQPEVLC